MQCTVNYTGIAEWAPRFEWADDNGTILDYIDNSVAGRVDVSVQRTASVSNNGFAYSAKLHFIEYNGTVPEDTASNIPNLTHIHHYDPVEVHCE
jgi:hypothetical protein